MLMDVNLHSNELEARFRLRLFTFLRSQEDLKQLISNDPTKSTQSSTINYSQLRLELGRFLAAYYLNFSFPLLFKNIKKLDISHKDISNSENICILPNLIIWSELEEQWIDENKEENNLNLNNNHWQLGQILLEDCSPKLAIYLLLREERILEAIFFVDHFNDLRANLLLRFFAEKIYSLQLLSDFCRNLLIRQFLERILFLENFDNAQTFTNNQEIIKYIQQNLEAALNIDILFPSNFHNYIGFFDCLIAECAYHMGAEFEKLLEDFSFGNEFICSSDNIRYLSRFLPRPPIFSIPLEEDNLNLFSNKNSLEKNQESLSWLRLHRCYLIISMAFGISNRMENLIGFSALWMAQSQENSNKNNKINEFTNNSSNDLSIILEKQLFIGHSENEIYTDLNIFQTLFSVVIGMQIRELLIKSIKNNDFELINKYKIKLEVLSFPFKNASQEPKENELIWKSIKRWIKLAETEDLDAAALFLHTLQQQNQKYFKMNFPPLNELNRPNWYLLILSGAEEKFNLNELTELNKNNLQIFPSENYRFRLNNFEDILIMQYLSSEFPIVNLPPSLIQMRLELVPDEFCSCNRRSFVSKNLNKNTKNNIIESFDEIGRKFSFKINENNLIKEENICKKEEIDELEILAEEIRSGIKRLELLEEETNLINGKKMGNLQAIEGINEINRSVKQQKNIRPKHQLKPNKKLSKITKIKRQSITQSDLERKQKTYSAFLSFLLKQKGIEGSEELTTTTEPLKSSSEINNNYYSTNNSVDSSESRSSLNSNKGRRKNKKINYSSKLNEEEESSTSNWASEEEEEEKNIFEKELTKEQLLQEMNKVGKHLEWIWAQIGGRINEENVDGEDYDNEEVEEGEDKQKEEEILERKENSYDQKLLELENEEYFKENKEGKEEILQQEPNEQKFSSEEEFPNNNIEIKQFKMPEIRIKSNVDFSIPSLIEEEKSYELRELEEIEEIELNSNNISFKAGEIKPASGQLSSSSGYHPHHSSCSSSENSARKNESLINKSFQNWSIPPNIQPMDFSRLDIDSDEEKNSGGKTINKWTDIEVYPREILKEKTPIIINEKMQTSNQQKTPLKNKWRPPSWLRLLPPFDGTIRTERISCGKITAERQLLQLNLDRGHQRTFLDIAAKNKESLKRLKKKEKAEEINKVKTNEEIKEEQSKQNFPEQSSIYDSGIALDQTANTSRYQQDFLLYSIELCEEEIEIMRQMAKQT